MEITHPDAPVPTPADLHQLELLKRVIERAIADGRVSRAELDAIQRAEFADGKVTVEELQLYRTLVLDKIEQGELQYDW